MEKIYIQEKLMGSPGQVVSFVSDSNLTPPYRAIVKDAPFIQGKSAILTVHAPDRYSRIVVTNGITTLESNPSYLEYVPYESDGLETLNDESFYVTENDDRVFYLPTLGEWVVAATKGGIQTQSSINIPSAGDYEITLSYFNAYIDVEYILGSICKCTNGIVTMTATDTDGSYRFTVNNPGDWVVQAVLPDGSNASAKSVYITNNQEQIFVDLTDSVNESLNSNSWSTINAITKLGLASSYWSIGDCKKIKLNGSIGSKTFSNKELCVELIGFDHNTAFESNSKPTLTFQLGKENVTSFIRGNNNGTRIGLYDNSQNPAFYMQSTATNAGGWENSYMRKTLLPQVRNCLPSDLQGCLIYVKKYTDNSLNTSHTASDTVTAVYDDIFLLSEYEVFASTTYSNSNEATDQKQKQYAYYTSNSTNASRIRYKDNDTSTATAYWLRSPSRYDGSKYCYINNSGTGALGNANTGTYMISPVFVIGG